MHAYIYSYQLLRTHTGYHCAGETRTVMYTCCRDGNKREHTGPSKTGKTRKHQQNRKLENYCIAMMIATENRSEGRVEVKYISTHTNHELSVTECRNLPLPNSVREDICQQFAAGISLERIMDSMYTCTTYSYKFMCT